MRARPRGRRRATCVLGFARSVRRSRRVWRTMDRDTFVDHRHIVRSVCEFGKTEWDGVGPRNREQDCAGSWWIGDGGEDFGKRHYFSSAVAEGSASGDAGAAVGGFVAGAASHSQKQSQLRPPKKAGGGYEIKNNFNC